MQPSFLSGFVGSTGSPGQPSRSVGSHRVMTFPIFSSTWPGSSLGLTGSRIDLPVFKTMSNRVLDEVQQYLYYTHTLFFHFKLLHELEPHPTSKKQFIKIKLSFPCVSRKLKSLFFSSKKNIYIFL